MRFKAPLLAAVAVAVSCQFANAARSVEDAPLIDDHAVPALHSLEAPVSLNHLVSPSVRFSYLSFDALKNSGFDIDLTRVSTADLLTKSDAIRTVAVAQTQTATPQVLANHRLYSAFLILAAGLMMYLGISSRRNS